MQQFRKPVTQLMQLNEAHASASLPLADLTFEDRKFYGFYMNKASFVFTEFCQINWPEYNTMLKLTNSMQPCTRLPSEFKILPVRACIP
jgi:hypothetical protein